MSASRIYWRMPGHSSPSPMSVFTPGLTSKSTTRIAWPVTPCLPSSSSNWFAINSVLESAGEGDSVQTRAIAESEISIVRVFSRRTRTYTPLRRSRLEAMASAPVLPREPGLFSRQYLWITLGSCALVFLGAFESVAVTTVMPVVSADLGGASLYALAFAGPLATGVIGMVVAGNWCDRAGPIVPLYTSAVLFVIGLLIAGTAMSMPILVAGRLVQGLGAGAINVALYVVVARVYPARLHPQIFAGFAAAWVIPSLIGPFAAGVVTEVFSWHWVFLGVVGLVAGAAAMVWPALRGLTGRDSDADPEAWSFGRIAWAIVAAAAVLGL